MKKINHLDLELYIVRSGNTLTINMMTLKHCCFDISSSEDLSAKWGRGILNNLLLNKAECIVLHSMAQ